MDKNSLVRAFVCLLASAAFAPGCAPAVGDACISSAECGPRQFCDTTAPGGYCLRFDCFDDACPDEAICVDFGDVNACMKRCDSDRDCRERDGYECRDDVGGVPFCYAPVSEDLRPVADGDTAFPEVVTDAGSDSSPVEGSGGRDGGVPDSAPADGDAGSSDADAGAASGDSATSEGSADAQ